MSDRNSANRTLYRGDNPDLLRGMNSETVHLIATDPPVNKSRDFHATPDNLASGASLHHTGLDATYSIGISLSSPFLQLAE